MCSVLAERSAKEECCSALHYFVGDIELKCYEVLWCKAIYTAEIHEWKDVLDKSSQMQSLSSMSLNKTVGFALQNICTTEALVISTKWITDNATCLGQPKITFMYVTAV